MVESGGRGSQGLVRVDAGDVALDAARAARSAEVAAVLVLGTGSTRATKSWAHRPLCSVFTIQEPNIGQSQPRCYYYLSGK